MVSWEKLVSQPHQTRLSWNCAFFHEMGAAMAQKKSTTKANISGALSRKSAHKRSSTKRKALSGFQASNPCAWRSKNAPVRCHQNAEEPPRWGGACSQRPLKVSEGLYQFSDDQMAGDFPCFDETTATRLGADCRPRTSSGSCKALRGPQLKQ